MKTIYYLIPNIPTKVRFSMKALLKSTLSGTLLSYLRSCIFHHVKPIGGIKVIYQHCLMLKESGYPVYPLLMGQYEGNFFGFEIETKKYQDVKHSISKDDVIVATEFEPYDGLQFNEPLKIMFVQNWWGVDNRRKLEDRNKSYIEMGYDHVITCSDYCSQYVNKKMNIPVHTITNGIDLSLFTLKSSERKKNTVLAMSRKNPKDLARIIELTKNTNFSIKVVDGLSQSELIKEYHSADIFLALGYPEGFSLPPLEAMACGCVVIGFTGGAASEFMINGETALVSPDGDCERVADDMLTLYENEDLKEKLRRNGYEKASQYSLDTMKKQLSKFYKEIVE